MVDKLPETEAEKEKKLKKSREYLQEYWTGKHGRRLSDENSSPMSGGSTPTADLLDSRDRLHTDEDFVKFTGKHQTAKFTVDAIKDMDEPTIVRERRDEQGRLEERTSVQLAYSRKEVGAPVCRVVDTVGTTSHIYEARLTTGKSSTDNVSTTTAETSHAGVKSTRKPKFKTLDFGFKLGFLKPKDEDNEPPATKTNSGEIENKKEPSKPDKKRSKQHKNNKGQSGTKKKAEKK